MHRTIGYLSKQFVQIRPGEGRKVFLTFLSFFLIITAYYVIKPVSRSLILGELGSRLVPYVDLVCALLMGPVVTLFARLVDRLSKHALVSGSFWAVIALLLVFWRLIHWPVAWVAGMFYIWVSIFSVLVVTLFWLVANDLYRPREAKRLFGVIGSGGILGGIVGSTIAAVGAQVVGTEHLPALSAGVLLLCWAIVQRLWRYAPEREEEGPRPGVPGQPFDADDRYGRIETGLGSARRTPHGPSAGGTGAPRDTFLSNVPDFMKLLFQSRYLLLIVSLVAINKMVAGFVYYQFNPFLESAFPTHDARTTFTGMYFGAVNIAAFIMQFFLTSWILRRWGLLTALLVLPTSLLAGTTALVCAPLFWVAAVTELTDNSLNYSLQQTTKEMLYLPIDRSIRYKVKPFIDMVVFRFGKGMAAVCGILLLDVWHVPLSTVGVLTIVLIVGWLIVVGWLRHDYVATIRTMLQARAAARRAASRSVRLAGAPSSAGGALDEAVEPFGVLSNGSLSERKLEVAAQLLTTEAPLSGPAKELLDALKAYEIHLGSPLELLEEGPSHWKGVVSDHQGSVTSQRQAIRLLTRAADQATVDFLLGVMLLERDALLRYEAARGLVRLRVRRARLEFPVRLIHRQIAAEVANYQRIRQVMEVSRGVRPGQPASWEAVLALLEVLLKESVEQVFRLLMLVHRPQDIQLVYEQLYVSDAYLRTDAMELLDNLVDPPLRTTLLPILEYDPFDAPPGEGSGPLPEPAVASRILSEAVWDAHRWLSVTACCAIGRFRLSPMRQELEKALRHQDPLVAMAAKVALRWVQQEGGG